LTVFRHIAAASALIVCANVAIAQGASLAFGSLQQDTTEPVEISADQLAIDQTDGIATFSGNVVIGQGNMRLSAPRVRVAYLENNAGIQTMTASGGVTLVSGEDAAESQRADYNVEDGVIVMIGDVLMMQGDNAISAERMTVDLEAGTANLSGRVKTILQPTGGN